MSERREVPWLRCGGIIGPETTREELRDRGITEEGIEELMLYRAYLEARERGEVEMGFEAWRELRE